MLYYNFCNYDGFKNLFGIQHHGNGVKSRKNKILLSYIKNKELLHNAGTTGDYHLLHISSMAELKQTLTEEIKRSGQVSPNLTHKVIIRNDIFWSANFYTDDNNGLCEDGDFSSIRYISVENNRIFKMRIGKFYRKIILETPFGRSLPESMLIYLCEEMAQDWQTHTMGCLPKNKLFVNKEFGRIYSSRHCVGNFGSCMTDDDYYTFYKNAVDASAAYLENEEGMIIARCIIYNNVRDQNGKVWRLAERQYSTGDNDILKRALVEALIQGGYIDGYKQVGAGCSDSRSFVDIDGSSLYNREFSIDCNLNYGDPVSYQDSFKSYDIDARVATNFDEGDIDLAVTNGEIEDDREYDDYHDRYCNEVTSVYYHGSEIYCDSDDLGDFIYINGDYFHEDDVSGCPECGDSYLSENSHWSEITDDYYCCSDCMERAEQRYKEENWTYSDYDKKYFEDADDVVDYMYWNPFLNRYDECTISRESLDYQIAQGDFYLIGDVAYDEINTETGRPYGESSDEEVLNEAA